MTTTSLLVHFCQHIMPSLRSVRICAELVAFALIFSSHLSSCSKAEEKPMTEAKTAQNLDSAKAQQKTAAQFVVDTAKSRIFWEGSEGLLNIKETHVGTFSLQSGMLAAQDGRLSGGTFVIDIVSLKNTDIKSISLRRQQEKHLKSEDFFDAAKFPTATFELASTAQHTSPDSVNITGNLTMKSVAKSITFPAKVVLGENSIHASAKFYINRKDWGMNYRTEKSLGDELIRPEVGIGLEIVAQK